MTHRTARRLAPLVAIVTATFVISQFYRTATAVIAPDLRREAGLSPELLGVLTGAFFVAIGVMQVPVGALLDRYGPRRVISALLSLSVAGAIVFSQADAPATFVLGQGMIGVGCAGVFVGGLVVFSRWFPVHRFGAVGAVTMAVSNLGTMASGTPFAAIVAAIGWRGGYLLAAGVTAVLGLLVLAVVRDAPEGHPFHERETESLAATLRGVGEVAANRAIWGILIMSFGTYAAVISIRGLWGGPYLADIHGLGGIARGNALLAMSVAIAAGGLFYGLLDYLRVPRLRAIVGGALANSVCFGLLAAVPMPGAVAAAAMFCLIGFGGTYVVLLLAHARAHFPDRLTGRAITTVNLSNFAGASVMMIVPGWVLGAFAQDGGHPPEAAYRTVFALLGALLLVAAVLFLRIDGRRRTGRPAGGRGGG